jgi:hypothetical protein
VVIEMVSLSGISESAVISVLGTSMVGMGRSAAATEARNCSVGAWKLEAFRLRTFNLEGRGGDGGEYASVASVFGSGVVGLSSW